MRLRDSLPVACEQMLVQQIGHICMHRNSLIIGQPGVAMSGRAGRPSSASPAQAPAPSWRGSRRRCGWWPLRSWFSRLFLGSRMRAHLTRKIMMGEMMRTRRRIAIPNACCWFAVFNSLSTVSLNRKNIQKLFFSLLLIEYLHKAFSQSYQDVPQLLCIVEGDRVVLEQGF